MSENRNFYRSPYWKRLARFVKRRDGLQCQICGDRKGDPYCELHAHHVVSRSTGGPDVPVNLITLCDLCHAVVTRRWHRPWFGDAAIAQADALEAARLEYLAFLALPTVERTAIQTRLWQQFGIAKASTAAASPPGFSC